MEGILNAGMDVISLVNMVYPVGIRIWFDNEANPNVCWPWQTWTQGTDGWTRTA